MIFAVVEDQRTLSKCGERQARSHRAQPVAEARAAVRFYHNEARRHRSVVHDVLRRVESYEPRLRRATGAAAATAEPAEVVPLLATGAGGQQG